MQEDLAHIDLLRLFRSAHVYVSPFRSEGFGLGTLEAMAMGLQACCSLLSMAAWHARSHVTWTLEVHG